MVIWSGVFKNSFQHISVDYSMVLPYAYFNLITIILPMSQLTRYSKKTFQVITNSTNILILPIFFICSTIYVKSKFLSGILNF